MLQRYPSNASAVTLLWNLLVTVCQREYSSRCNISHKVNCFARNSSSTRDVTPHLHTLCDCNRASTRRMLHSHSRHKNEAFANNKNREKYTKMLHLCLHLILFQLISLPVDTEQVVSTCIASTEHAILAVTTQVYVPEVFLSNLVLDKWYPDRGFSYLSSVPPGEFWDCTTIKPRPLRPKSFKIYHSSIIPTFDVI